MFEKGERVYHRETNCEYTLVKYLPHRAGHCRIRGRGTTLLVHPDSLQSVFMAGDSVEVVAGGERFLGFQSEEYSSVVVGHSSISVFERRKAVVSRRRAVLTEAYIFGLMDELREFRRRQEDEIFREYLNMMQELGPEERDV